ncbi:MAG: hypothetical protein RSE41_01300 [Clostridia bacterium]
MSIKFVKTREVKSPKRAMSREAGIDFFVPTFTEQFMSDLTDKNPKYIFDETFMVNEDNSTTKGLVILPHERILIPAGIKLQLPSDDRALQANNKSGVATKKGLIFGAELVDYTYRGEVHLSLINTSNDRVEIFEGEKLIQFVEIMIGLSEMEEVNSIDTNTERGEGAFGHTGNR